VKLSRVWSLLTVEKSQLQYGGNDGYLDRPEHSYHYDSEVPNHKQLSVGDLVVIRSKKKLIGLSRIQSIQRTENSKKHRQRCPECTSTNIKTRKKLSGWKCHKCGLEFSKSIEEDVLVTSYEASYGTAFLAMPSEIPIDLIKSSILRPSDQLSIAELDLGKIEAVLLAANDDASYLIQNFVSSLSMADSDAVIATEEEIQPYIQSATDSRQAVLRAIKLRRGQRKFRDGLIRAYGSKCMISGCGLLSVLEAAHIDCYRGDEHNHIVNGLLLRADLHTLFDLGLLAIDPDSLIVRVHADAKAGTDYEKFDGCMLALKGKHSPSVEALSRRWKLFLESQT